MRLSVAVAVLLLGVGPAAAVEDRPSDHGAYFLKTFGPARPRDARDEQLLAEARRVFDAVAAVADKKLGRHPRLLAIEKGGGLEAQALPDGTIVVNLALLRFCFPERDPDLENGRARLGFVLGHEMAHLAHDDQWHARFFDSLRGLGGTPLPADFERWAVESVGDQQKKEMHADSAGFVSMTMAGFRPPAVLGAKTDFLRDWSRYVQGQSTVPVADDAREWFDERSRMLHARLDKLAQIEPFFRFGVRLVQIGRFGDAIPLLERARAEFPSREVQSNLGVAWYQRALSRLAECGVTVGTRFKLPLTLDPVTLAARSHLRTWRASECPQAAAIREDLRAAEEALTSAVEHDRRYLTARLNLASLWLVDDRPLKAADLVRETRARAEATSAADGRVSMLEALALYASGEPLKLDTADSALQMLDDLEAKCQAGIEPCLGHWAAALRPAVRFNRSRILEERGRAAAARQAWRDFLALEPHGAYADAARVSLLRLGEPVDYEPEGTSSRSAQSTLLDRLAPEVRSRLRAASRQRFTAGEMRGAFLSGSGLEALEVRGVVELIEVLPASPVEGSSLADRAGDVPVSVQVAAGGQQTVVYRDAAYDVEGGRITRQVMFQAR